MTRESTKPAGILKKAKELGGQSVIYGLGDTLYKSIAFILLPVYLKHLSPEQYGTAETMLVTSGVAITLLASGTPAAVFRFFYRAKNEEERSIIIGTTFYFSITVQLIGSLLILWKSDVLSNLVFKDPSWSFLFSVLALNIFLASFRQIPMSLFRARKQAWRFITVNFAVALTTLLLNVYFVAFREMGVSGVIFGNLCGAVVGLVIVTPVVIKDIGLVFRGSYLPRILAYSVPILFVTLSSSIVFMADRYFLVRMEGIYEVGIYALAYKLGSIVQVFVVMPFLLAWTPFVFSHEDDPNAPELFGRMATYFVLAGIFLVVGLSVYSYDLVYVLAENSEYHRASGLVPVLCFAFLGSGIANICGTGIKLSGKTYLLTIAGVICLTANLVLNFVLIGRYGTVGAAISLLLTFVIQAILNYVFSSRLYVIDFEYGRILYLISLSVIVITVSQYFSG